MQSQTMTLDKPVIDLPKTWENARVFVDFPDNETVIVKKAATNKNPINYSIDNENWSAIKDDARENRDSIFKEFYPELYGKKQKA